MTYERLKGLRTAEASIREIREEIAELKGGYLPGSGFSGAGGRSGEPVSRTERLALKKIRLEEKLAGQLQAREEEVIAGREYIARVRDPEIRKILRFRFIRGFSWRRVAEAMGRVDMADVRRMQFRRWAAANLEDWGQGK